jgi:hypothetical protein
MSTYDKKKKFFSLFLFRLVFLVFFLSNLNVFDFGDVNRAYKVTNVYYRKKKVNSFVNVYNNAF